MRIIVDAMGGDNAPQEIVKGALRARKELGVELTLVGREEDVRACLENGESEGIEIVDAREVVTMEDDPSTATRRKKDSSMAVALRLLAEGKGDAVVSAGSTGALLTGATLTVKRIRGIRRAALAPILPAGEHGVMLIDCGANVECTACSTSEPRIPRAASCSIRPSLCCAKRASRAASTSSATSRARAFLTARPT